MGRNAVIAGAAAFILASGAGFAEDARFELRETAAGLVRLDVRTGQMSTCTRKGADLVCRAAADDIRTLQDEIAALDGRLAASAQKTAALEADNEAQRASVARLELRVRELEGALRAAGRPVPEERGRLAEGLPSEQEVEEVASWFEMVMRVFSRMMGLPAEEPAPPADKKAL